MYSAPTDSLGYGTDETNSLRNLALRSLARAGYGLRRSHAPDVRPEVASIVETVRPYTMTSQASIVGLCEAVEYLVQNRLEGSIVECGVWRGGSMMAAALMLLTLGASDRDIYLFDTFTGMPRPGDRDASIAHPERPTLTRWERDDRGAFNEWAYTPVDQVRANVISTGYPPQRVHLVAGRVEESIPAHAPTSIALLRLDTDWYSSTKHELDHLYPRLAPRGILILDDYGSWAGARQAADEYLPVSELFLARLDSFARIAVKPET